MKTSKSLFYSGLALVVLPILVIVILWWASAKIDNHNEKKSNTEKKIVYDTVKVKVVDTVVIQKIKYVKKVESNISDSSSR